MDESSVEEGAWFYVHSGQRKGPVTTNQINELIKSGMVSYGSLVWSAGFSEWQKVEDSSLRVSLSTITPPPLTGENVNNSIVWVLAFAPLIGRLIEVSIAHASYDPASGRSVADIVGNLWFITIILNIALSYFDENRLRHAGHNTSKFRGWTWLVPVYLYQRSKSVRQSKAYFIVWLVAFYLSLLPVY
jgi:hypothetical protein